MHEDFETFEEKPVDPVPQLCRKTEEWGVIVVEGFAVSRLLVRHVPSTLDLSYTRFCRYLRTRSMVCRSDRKLLRQWSVDRNHAEDEVSLTLVSDIARDPSRGSGHNRSIQTRAVVRVKEKMRQRMIMQNLG